MWLFHGPLGIVIAQVLDYTTIGPADTDRYPCRVSLVGMRSAGPWVNQLILNHLLKQLLIIGTHVIGFGEAVDELLTQR